MPEEDAVVTPRLVEPSKISTAEFGSAEPVSVTALLAWTLFSAGAVITGLAGADVSTENIRLAGVGSTLPAASVART